MQDWSTTYNVWAKHVWEQPAGHLLPQAWLSPLRVIEQRKGLKDAMTFGDLQKMLITQPWGPQAAVMGSLKMGDKA
jgi:hypothetical protein